MASQSFNITVNATVMHGVLSGRLNVKSVKATDHPNRSLVQVSLVTWNPTDGAPWVKKDNHASIYINNHKFKVSGGTISFDKLQTEKYKTPKWAVDHNADGNKTIEIKIEGAPFVNAAFSFKLDYIPPKFTVNFDSAGGSAVPSQTVQLNNKVNKPQNPTKPEHYFDKWMLGNSPYNFNNPVTSNFTLTATWILATIKNMYIGNPNGQAVQAQEFYIGNANGQAVKVKELYVGNASGQPVKVYG